MATYSGSIDISLVESAAAKTIVGIRNLYYISESTDINDIPEPYVFHYAKMILRISDGVIKTDEGAIELVAREYEWSYDKPEFRYGYHLWTSYELKTQDETYIYSEAELSSEWESFYNVDVGGLNLIRNSKNLIDTRITLE